MRNWMNIVEGMNETYTLYHGTCSAEPFLKSGWEPGSGSVGGNMGQNRYLYLTNMPENAKWYANEKGCDTVLVIKNVPANYLRVDPEDGTYDTVEEELGLSHGLPGVVVLTKALGPEHFELYSGNVEEHLSAGASAEDYIHDFVHSKNERFKGKSKKERVKMALGAWYSKHKK